MKKKIIIYKDQECRIKYFYYANNRKGMFLINIKTGKQVVRCTLNLADYSFEKNEVIIKNYGDCEGVYQALHEANILRYTKKRIPIGYNYGLICKLIK